MSNWAPISRDEFFFQAVPKAIGDKGGGEAIQICRQKLVAAPVKGFGQKVIFFGQGCVGHSAGIGIDIHR